VERDLDLIAPMAERGLASVFVTVTSLDGELVRKLEPRAASPARRLRTIRTLAQAGVPVGVSVAPQIPFINEDMEQVLAAASEAGARQAFYTVLRLPWELGEVFQDWLHAHFPDRAARVMARVRDLRDGRINDAMPGRRMRGQGLWADLLSQRFARACRQLGLNQDADASPRARVAMRPAPVARADPADPDGGQASLF
jgi:DNA repair photolyase